MIAVLLSVVALAAPAPDPPPEACFQGWCPVPSTRPYQIGPMHIAHHSGLWECTVSRRSKMLCWRVA